MKTCLSFLLSLSSGIFSKKSIFPVFFSLLLLVGCSKDDGNQGGDITPTPAEPTPTPSEEPVTPAVPIDWEKTTVASMDLETGNITLNFSGEIPAFVNGESAIVVPVGDTIAYIRVVEKATISGQSVSLQTSEGNMTDIFMDQSFSISFSPDPAATKAGYDADGVIHPVKIVARNADGSTEVLYDAKNPSATKGDIEEIKLQEQFVKIERDFTNDILFQKNGVSLSWEKGRWGTWLDAEAQFDFGGREVEIDTETGEVKKVRKGDLMAFFFLLKGTIEADFMLKLAAMGEIKEEGKRQLPAEAKITFTFTVGPVPMLVTANAILMAEASAIAKGKLEATTGFYANFNVKRGIRYLKGDPLREIEPVIKDTFKIYPPTLTGEASAEIKVSVYPRIEVKLYNFIGPYFEIGPYLKDDWKFGMKAEAGSADNYAAWRHKFSTGFDMNAGLKVDFWDFGKIEMPLTLPGIDIPIITNPESIKLLSPSNTDTYKAKEPVTVTFEVNQSFWGETNKASQLAVVRFETANGTLDKTYALSGLDGKVTVTWTPVTVDGGLKAFLPGPADGNSIAEAVFNPPIEKEEFDASMLWGTWATKGNIMGYDGIKSRYTFYPDGTFEQIFNTNDYVGTYLEKTDILGIRNSEGESYAYYYSSGLWQISAEPHYHVKGKWSFSTYESVLSSENYDCVIKTYNRSCISQYTIIYPVRTSSYSLPVVINKLYYPYLINFEYGQSLKVEFISPTELLIDGWDLYTKISP